MRSARPNIGITAATETVSYGAWEDVPAVMSPAGYVRAVQRAGGRPVLLCPDPEDTRDPGELLDLLDAVIITGGAGDLDPALYGQEPHPEAGPVQEERDAYELSLARAARQRGDLTLGVCRGMQMLNVVYGGSVEQHLPDVLGHEGHRVTRGIFSDHEVGLEPGSLAARAVGGETTPVKSHHHQGVREAGPGLVVTGKDPEDGAVEAIEDPEKPFFLGVLWHPEEDENSRVIEALVSKVMELKESTEVKSAGGR
ncbi:gamma-glutamyl-gamma-aminobutyrate hydrolase family protein [Rubrobacter aplysinae]|uniref:gamma-glutamyl-gamma-aminobutyrate hydrolase family protein n=1 Tax=Rubrobacter aplysinae TaxID=909625 RepID=UPI001F446B1E|nr:gamma-glutamyl-gamma-aminobutyrate hydrolase family protein [Rubrobacter aplysinae]